MRESRRRLLMTAVGAAGVLAARPFLAAWQTPGVWPAPQPRPSPKRTQSQFSLRPGWPASHRPGQEGYRRQNQKEIKAHVTKLYEMASDLKNQVDKTDPASTLSVAVVKKAQEIEKLAKQIKNLARG